MSAKFFLQLKKWFAIALCLSVVGGSVLAAGRLTSTEVVPVSTRFYFLVSMEDGVESVAYFSRLEGGAGYILTEGEEARVALSVYFTRSAGEKIANDLENEGKRVRLVTKTPSNLYFSGSKKERAKIYLSGIRLLESYMQVLNGVISRLENGDTQESCKRVLQEIEGQFAYAERSYSSYAELAQVCATSKKALSQLQEEVVLLKDLRYLLCWQADKHAELCDRFCL